VWTWFVHRINAATGDDPGDLERTRATSFCALDRLLNEPTLSRKRAYGVRGLGLSSVSIGGHIPLMQRSQNFLLVEDALEFVTLPRGPGSPLLQADKTPAPVRSNAMAIRLEIIISGPN
jgi:hypothetical protein